jgi:hypothetical protein
MKSSKATTYTLSAINSVTDPGVFLNLGNAFLNAAQSAIATTVNVATAALCASIRMASELEKRGMPLPLPNALRKFVKNPGASLATNGGLTVLSAAFAAASIDPNNPVTALPAVILGLFGAGNLAQGQARSLKEGGVAQRVSDSGAQVAYSTALVLASSDAPLPVQLCFVFSGVAGVGLALAKRQSLAKVSPLLINAACAFGSAATNPNPVLSAANALWGVGYVGIDILQRTSGGGVVEVTQNIFKRRRPETSDTAPSDLHL